MGRVFRPTYTVPATGKRVTVKSWYAEWFGADKKTHRKKIGPDKREATEALAAFEAHERRVRLGLDTETKVNPDRLRPLTELLGEYIALLEAKDTSEQYRIDSSSYLRRIFTGCRWDRWDDITGDSLTLYLGSRRKVAGNAPTTVNNYLACARSFTRWLAERLNQPDPLRKVQRVAVTEKRRSKRILTDAELEALIAAAERGKRKGNYRFAGPDRAMLYRLAAYTGLRASELASLTPERFDLDASPPIVTVEAKDSKGKRLEPLPVPAMLLGILRPWLKKKRKGYKLWPGSWAKKKSQVDWLATDLRRAGVAEFDSKGRRATFHGLRRGYVVRVIAAGAKIHEVRRLARHTAVRTTLEFYTDETLADLGAIVDRMK